jgi:hypothetical protein
VVKSLSRSGIKEGGHLPASGPKLWVWWIPVLESEGMFTSASLKSLHLLLGLVLRNLWKERSYARSQCIPRMKTMAVVTNNSGSNTKMHNKGQCLAKESTLLLLGLVFTHS